MFIPREPFLLSPTSTRIGHIRFPHETRQTMTGTASHSNPFTGERVWVNGHDLLDARGQIIGAWGYDHESFRSSGRMIVCVVGGLSYALASL